MSQRRCLHHCVPWRQLRVSVGIFFSPAVVVLPAFRPQKIDRVPVSTSNHSSYSFRNPMVLARILLFLALAPSIPICHSAHRFNSYLPSSVAILCCFFLFFKMFPSVPLTAISCLINLPFGLIYLSLFFPQAVFASPQPSQLEYCCFLFG